MQNVFLLMYYIFSTFNSMYSRNRYKSISTMVDALIQKW